MVRQGSAPGCPEIDDNRAVGLQYLLFEFGIGDVGKFSHGVEYTPAFVGSSTG